MSGKALAQYRQEKPRMVLSRKGLALEYCSMAVRLTLCSTRSGVALSSDFFFLFLRLGPSLSVPTTKDHISLSSAILCLRIRGLSSRGLRAFHILVTQWVFPSKSLGHSVGNSRISYFWVTKSGLFSFFTLNKHKFRMVYLTEDSILVDVASANIRNPIISYLFIKYNCKGCKTSEKKCS